jgi:hypothetical protein
MKRTLILALVTISSLLLAAGCARPSKEKADPSKEKVVPYATSVMKSTLLGASSPLSSNSPFREKCLSMVGEPYEFKVVKVMKGVKGKVQEDAGTVASDNVISVTFAISGPKGELHAKLHFVELADGVYAHFRDAEIEGEEGVEQRVSLEEVPKKVLR